MLYLLREHPRPCGHDHDSAARKQLCNLICSYTGLDMLRSSLWMSCRQAAARDGSAATFNTQHPSTRPVRLQPHAQAGTCFDPAASAAPVASPPAAAAEVYLVEADVHPSGSSSGEREVLQRVGLDALAGEMLLLRLTLPLPDAPRFARLPRWREAESEATVAAVRGALDAPGLLYYAVRIPTL